MKVNEVYQGDCRDLLRQLEDESIDCIVTSPPYWRLREYDAEASVWDGDPKCEHNFSLIYKTKKQTTPKAYRGRMGNENNQGRKEVGSEVITIDNKSQFCSKCNAWKGQLGLEPTFDLYINHLCDIFDIIKEKLKKEGTCWINLGDSYGSGKGYDDKYQRNEVLQFKSSVKGYQKCLLLIPERFAIEMTNRGWILRNVIIWQKPNCMPCSAKDRFTVDFEYVFFFVKNKKYFFNQQFKKSTTEFIYSRNSKKGDIQETNNPRNNWGLTREEYKKNKYKNLDHETKHRAGMNKDRGNNLIEKRDLPPAQELIKYLKIWKKKAKKTYKEIDKELEVIGDTASHFFTSPESPHGFAYPSKENWIKLKEILGFDGLFDNSMTNVYYETDTIGKSGMKENYSLGRNKRTTWTIPTKPNPEAHFATFPPDLVKPMIKAGCPLYICKVCGKAREKIIELGKVVTTGGSDKGLRANNKKNFINTGHNCRAMKQHEHIIKGYSNCGCNAGFKAGIVLDPFAGVGTTCKTAFKLGRDFIGFDVSEKYIEIAKRLLKSTKNKRLTDFIYSEETIEGGVMK